SASHAGGPGFESLRAHHESKSLIALSPKSYGCRKLRHRTNFFGRLHRIRLFRRTNSQGTVHLFHHRPNTLRNRPHVDVGRSGHARVPELFLDVLQRRTFGISNRSEAPPEHPEIKVEAEPLRDRLQHT